MSILDHLEHTVSPAVLGKDASVSHISLLEQFYALVISKLAMPQVYSQFLRHQHINTSNTATSLFDQLWPSKAQRTIIIDELVATYHIDEATTVQLLINAAPLTYQALKDVANGQFLPAYLQGVAPSVRPYLPVWATSVLTEDPAPSISTVPSEQALSQLTAIKDSVPVMVEEDVISTDNPNTSDVAIAAVPDTDVKTDTISTRPADYRAETSSQAQYHAQQQTRARNRRHDLLVRLGLLTVLVAGLALLWMLVIKPNQAPPPDPVVVAPAPVVAPPNTTPALTPMELTLAIDDSGNLYTCTASVGDVDMQAALKQALMLNFGDQADTCDLSINDKVITSLPLSSQVLSDTFGLLRSVPFARLHLQNDRITLEAPDDAQLQRLLTDMQAIMPTMSIMAAAPLSIPQANAMNNSQPAEGAITVNNAQNLNESTIDNQSNLATDAVPAPPRPDNTINQPNNQNVNQNNQNNQNNSNAPARNPSTGLSLSEVEDLASTTFVAEELRGARPVDENDQIP